MSDSALDLFQQLLDVQCRAILAGDIRTLTDMMALPYRRKYANKTFLIETREEMFEEFERSMSSMKSVAMNSFIRLATRAEFMSEDYLTGYFVTHGFSNATPLFESFESRMTFVRRAGNDWAVVEQEANIHVYGWPVDVVRKPFKPGPLQQLCENDARRQSMSALSIYQTYLDQTAATVAANDFEAYADLMQFPYTANGSQLEQVIETPEDLRPFFNVLRGCHDGTVGDRIERLADRAEFVAGHLICGYHTGTVYKGTAVTVQPVHSCMVLCRTGTRWRLQSVNNSVDNSEYPFSMFQPGGTRRTHLEIQQRTKE